MENVEFNARLWDGAYNWSEAGEEWSTRWGGSRAQWFGSLYPRISAFLPARSLLEIAPGYGRWTRFLLAACDRYVGVDLSQECVSACKSRFSRVEKASFFKNDGTSLGCAETGTVDFVFSFDSLVHASKDIMAAYSTEILRVLSSNGTAFIHHSNWQEVGAGLQNAHGRGTDVSADYVRSTIASAGGKVLIQEKINWGFDQCTDCLTLFCRADAYEWFSPVIVENHSFMSESDNIRLHQSMYSKIVRHRA